MSFSPPPLVVSSVVVVNSVDVASVVVGASVDVAPAVVEHQSSSVYVYHPPMVGRPWSLRCCEGRRGDNLMPIDAD